MLSRIYVLIYRMSFILKRSSTEGLLRRGPLATRGLDRLKRTVRHHLTERSQAWVRIESGARMSTGFRTRAPTLEEFHTHQMGPHYWTSFITFTGNWGRKPSLVILVTPNRIARDPPA